SERWDQIQQQSHGRWARSKQLEGWRGGAMVFDRNAAIQGETDKRGQSSMSVDEMVEAAQKLQQAEDIRERARISFLSREERITELLEQQASLMKESDQSRYGPGYAATELQLAKNWLELAQLEKAQNKPDKEKVKRWDRPATGDSLTRVGNFLGSSRDALNDIGLRQISLLQRIADNTAQGDGSGGYPAWDEDFPNT
ncbi:MAG: hypothetical protein NT154_17495, partial [Verrucomicrobia bacterium]|nr:hypothetical protein [Verrucomicrobiota bacterium]